MCFMFAFLFPVCCIAEGDASLPTIESVAFPGFDHRVLKFIDILAFLVFRFIPAR